MKQIIEILKSKDFVASEGVGIGGLPSSDWYAFAYMMYLADNKSLLKLSQDTKNGIKVYAYIGLVHNNYPGIDSVRKRLSKDTGRLATISGCVLEGMRVADAINKIGYWYEPAALNAFLTVVKNNLPYRKALFSALIAHSKTIPEYRSIFKSRTK